MDVPTPGGWIAAFLDPLAILFVLGSLAALWMLWCVLRDDSDLTRPGGEVAGSDATDSDRPAEPPPESLPPSGMARPPDRRGRRRGAA